MITPERYGLEIIGWWEPRIKISVIIDISVLGFYGFIGNIGEYFDKNIGRVEINKNTLKFMEILC